MSYDTEQFTDERAREKAEECNCDVEYADDFTLQLDLDSDASFDVFPERLGMLESLGLVPVGCKVGHRRSRGGNHHVTVSLSEPLPIERRILLQALLGSDPKREALCLAGMLAGQQQPILLFRPRSYDFGVDL